MMQIAPIPESLQSEAEQRKSQWLEALGTAYSGDMEQVARVLSGSDYLFQWAKRQPQWLVEALAADLSNLSANILSIQEKLDVNWPEYEVKQFLRHQRHYWSMQIAVADILQQLPIRQICYLQSVLAEQLINCAQDWSYYQTCQQYGVPVSATGEEQHLLVLAMGKLGGEELNFSSDVDLIFGFPEDGETRVGEGQRKSIENQMFFMRHGQKLISLLSDNTADGFVYRVDMRLRPYGQSGALVANFNALQDYYLEQGREWERFAMIKARILQAHPHFREQLVNIIRPFSFRRYIDFSVLESIRQLKQKITAELLRKDAQNNIKLGDGGIRELEFIVQSLQLISGGRHPQLQAKNWWQALEALVQQGLLKEQDATGLKSAYEFLRKLENSLQIHADKQTQDLPDSDEEQQKIALLMGYPDWVTVEKDLEQHQQLVSEFFKGLFHDPKDERGHNDAIPVLEQLLQGQLDSEQQIKILEQYHLSEETLKELQNFRQEFSERKIGARGFSRLEQLLPHLVIQASKQKDTDRTLLRSLEVLQGIGRRTAYFEMLAENIPVLEFLVQLVSRSSWLARQLAIYPSLLDELLFPSNFGKQLSKDNLANQLQQAMMRIEMNQTEEQLLALSRFKQSSQFKIAAGDLTRRFDISEVSQQLTDLAEVIMEYLLQLAWNELTAKHGKPRQDAGDLVTDFLVLGYGKLGGDELGYGSDLDLVFLYQGEPDALTQTTGEQGKPLELHQFYTRLAQRLVHYLGTRTQQGIMYEVDTRLRPSGRAGMLVSHIDAFEKYQLGEAWTWEHQALVRARPVAGDISLKGSYLELRNKVLSCDKRDQLSKDVTEMRQKMRDNLDKTDARLWDIKQGHGGLVDIEFLVQFWALKYSNQLLEQCSVKELPFNNVDWLQLLSEKGLLEKATRDCMMENYRLLRDIANARALQNQPALLPKEELSEQRQAIVELWQSTFKHSDVE